MQNALHRASRCNCFEATRELCLRNSSGLIFKVRQFFNAFQIIRSPCSPSTPSPPGWIMISYTSHFSFILKKRPRPAPYKNPIFSASQSDTFLSQSNAWTINQARNTVHFRTRLIRGQGSNLSLYSDMTLPFSLQAMSKFEDVVCTDRNDVQDNEFNLSLARHYSAAQSTSLNSAKWT